MVIIQWWSAEKYGAAVFCARAECWDASLRITLVLGMALLPLYHLPAGMQVFHTCRHVCFHMCLRVFFTIFRSDFPPGCFPQATADAGLQLWMSGDQECSGAQGQHSCALGSFAPGEVLASPLQRAPPGRHPFNKACCLFPKSIATETQPFQRNMSNTVWNTLSLQSTGRARSRWDIFQTLGKNKAS